MKRFTLPIPCYLTLRVLRKLPGGARWGSNLLVKIRARDPRIYIATEGLWATYWVGFYLRRYLKHKYPVRLAVGGVSFASCRVHFMSSHMYFGRPEAVHPTADVVATWWHGSRRAPGFEKCIERLPEASARARFVVTSCKLIEQELLACGVPPDKLIRIPLGVDTALFVPPTMDQRRAARERWGVPSDVFCVGSFQRDGDEEPKWVKGPDVMIRALEKAAKEVPLFVFLTGSARGYVKRELERLKIPYRHHELDEADYHLMPQVLSACDVCLIPSREEGGPLALLEAMAAKVPVVATRCGLCPELIRPMESGILADVEDHQGLAEGLIRLQQDPEIAARIAATAHRAIGDYDWEKIAQQYDEKIYRHWVREETPR